MNQCRIIDEDGVGEWLDADKVYSTAKHGSIVEDDACVEPTPEHRAALADVLRGIPIPDEYVDPPHSLMLIDWGADLALLGSALTNAAVMAFGLAAFRALPSFEEARRAVRQLLEEVDEALPTYGRDPLTPF